MNKIAWSACILAGTLTFAGCAVPQKPLIERPAMPSTVTRQPPLPPVLPEVQEEDLPIGPPPVAQVQPSAPAAEENLTRENPPQSLPSLQYINDRIFEYGRKIERWKELDSKKGAGEGGQAYDPSEMLSCFRRLQDVVQGYNQLREEAMQLEQFAQPVQAAPDTGLAPTTAATVSEVQKSDIEFLESPCARWLAEPGEEAADWSQRGESAELPQLETLIDRSAANREYQEVDKAWQQIPPAQRDWVSLRTRIHYGNALIHLDQPEKAAEVYRQIVDRMTTAADEQATDLVSLRKKLGDLYTATGNTKEAAAQYEKIADDYQNIGKMDEWSKLQLAMIDRAADAGPEMREYSSLLRDYLSYVPERQGYTLIAKADKFREQYPYSPVASNVDAIKADVQAAADRWFDGFMGEVDKLSGEKKFKEALEKLATMPQDILGPDKQLVVKSKNDELLLGEAVDRESDRMAQIQDLQNQWNKGMLLVGQEKFDEAIAVFTSLVNTEYGVKAREKVREVSLAAANAERKKAASLFVRFTKTTDLESRKKLLLESRRVLKGILEKYPDVEIAPKVASNIERVEQEMVAIDPAMLVFADDQDQTKQQVSPDGIDQVFAPPVVDTAARQQKEVPPPLGQ